MTTVSSCPSWFQKGRLRPNDGRHPANWMSPVFHSPVSRLRTPSPAYPTSPIVNGTGSANALGSNASKLGSIAAGIGSGKNTRLHLNVHKFYFIFYSVFKI